MKVVELFADSPWAIRICALCTEAKKEKGKYIGDPLDIALLEYAHDFDEKWDVDLTQPYEPETRMMEVRITRGDETYTLVKGAPEKITKMCSQMALNDKIVPFESERFEKTLQRMSQDGLRVLALAYKSEKDFIMVGLVGVMDPPRKEAINAIQAASKAGIRTVMITGDLPGTACNIARKVGLHHPLSVCTGAQIDEMDDQELKRIVVTTDIFARVTPIHKLRIVEQLQNHGEVVAMTGDGVNDAPPLQQADIGVSMGSGTDVAKEASDMVVLDDNLSSIVTAIRQGRVLFKSLQQMAAYLLTTCFGGVLTIASSVLMGLPLPLLPLQILWVNLVTDGTTTIPLAMEGEHGNLMLYPPRKRAAPFLSAQTWGRSLVAALVMMVGTLGIYSWSIFVRNDPLVYSRTLAFATLSIFQMCNAMNSRSLHRSLFFSYKNLKKIPFFQNRALLLVLLLCFILQIIAVEWTPLQGILETISLTAADWTFICLLCSSVIIFAELHKVYRATIAKR
jgi:Ca2+-transporting ATPase